MKVLFIGGTGLISTAASKLAVESGIELYLLNRGRNSERVPAGAKVIYGDICDFASVSKAIEGYSFDVVVNFIGFEPEHVETDVKLFSGKVKQYIYISSASAYEKPVRSYPITEKTPLINPFWDYSQKKIACEEYLMREYKENGFPVTIVRPSLTYGDTNNGLVFNSWSHPYTLIDRMKRGEKVIVPGDGTSLWVMTHNTDFAKGIVGLLGNQKAVGEDFHITSDEVMCWNSIIETAYSVLGLTPNIIHISSDFICRVYPDKRGSLFGDKAESVFFDNSKIKRFVPEFKATTSYREGFEKYMAYALQDVSRQSIDEEWNAELDKIISAYEGESNEI